MVHFCVSGIVEMHSLKQSCSALTSVTSALEVIFNVMRSTNPRFTYLLTSVQKIVLGVQGEVSVNLWRKGKLQYQRYDVAVVRGGAQLVADGWPAGAAQRVGRPGQRSGADQEPFDVVGLAGQRQPAFVAQLPAGVDEECRRSQLAVPRQPTQRRVTNRPPANQSINQSFNSSTYKDKNLTIQMNKWRTGTASLRNTGSRP